MIEKLEHYGVNLDTGHVVEPVERMMFDKINELIEAVNKLEALNSMKDKAELMDGITSLNN